MSKKIYWGMIGVLFSPLLVGEVLSLFGMLFGCQNWFEGGCAQGIGNIFGSIGFVGIAISLLTIPAAFFVSIVWLVSGLTIGTLRATTEKDPIQKSLRRKALLEVLVYLAILTLIFFGMPWLVNHVADWLNQGR